MIYPSDLGDHINYEIAILDEKQKDEEQKDEGQKDEEQKNEGQKDEQHITVGGKALKPYKKPKGEPHVYIDAIVDGTQHPGR